MQSWRCVCCRLNVLSPPFNAKPPTRSLHWYMPLYLTPLRYLSRESCGCWPCCPCIVLSQLLFWWPRFRVLQQSCFRVSPPPFEAKNAASRKGSRKFESPPTRAPSKDSTTCCLSDHYYPVRPSHADRDYSETARVTAEAVGGLIRA